MNYVDLRVFNRGTNETPPPPERKGSSHHHYRYKHFRTADKTHRYHRRKIETQGHDRPPTEKTGPKKQRSTVSAGEVELVKKKKTERQHVNRPPRQHALPPPPPPRSSWDRFWEWNFPRDPADGSCNGWKWTMTAVHICTCGLFLGIAWLVCQAIDSSGPSGRQQLAAAAPLNPRQLDVNDDDSDDGL